MDIWLTICRRRAKCTHCPEFIEKGQYIVVGKLWARSKEEGARRWTLRFRWHPECWVEQGKMAADRRPLITETRGRKKLDMSEGDKAARRSIIMRRASVMQRIKKEVDLKTQESIDKLIHLGDRLNKLKEEIKQYGGVPKSWE